MAEPQLERSQNVFQVTEEVGKENPPDVPVQPLSELSPSFTPPEESGLGEAVPPTGGGGIFRIILILVFLIVVIFFAYLVVNFLKSRGGGGGTVTLTYWGLWEDESIMQPLIDAYQKQNPNIKINYVFQTPKQYRERLEAAIQRGGEVDIFRFHNTWVPMLKEELAPLPESIFPTKDYETTFYPVVKSDLKLGQNYIGIPLMIDGLALFYNEEMLNSVGIKPPKEWDEFLNAAKKLTTPNPTRTGIVTAGAALGTAGNIEHFSDILALMLMQNEANLKNPVGPEASEALAYYRLFSEKPDNVWDENMPNSITAFAQGQVAMIFAPSWEALLIIAKNPNLKFKTAPVPQLPGTNVTWASYWVEGVAQTSKHQKEAWQFLKYLAEKDNMVKLYTLETQAGRAFGEPYSRSDLAQTLTDHPILGAFILQAPTACSFPLASRTYDDGLNDHLIKYLEDAVNSLSSGGSPEGALTTASQGFQQVLSQYGLVAASAAPTK